jgi:hypothetical protein
MGQHGSAHAAHDPPRPGDPAPWSGGGDLARRTGLDDIGRSPSGEAGTGRGHGVVDSSRDDETAGDPGADDLDDEDDDDFDFEDDDDFESGEEA